jgi:hypothetical protein
MRKAWASSRIHMRRGADSDLPKQTWRDAMSVIPFDLTRKAATRGTKRSGVFFFKSSAVRFARTKTAPAGCALMFLNAPFELDRNNEGSQVIEILTAAIGVARRRVPTLVCFVEMAVAEWRKLLAQLSRAVAGERRHRAAIEHELFHGHYRLASKIDDDLSPL